MGSWIKYFIGNMFSSLLSGQVKSKTPSVRSLGFSLVNIGLDSKKAA